MPGVDCWAEAFEAVKETLRAENTTAKINAEVVFSTGSPGGQVTDEA